MQTQRGKEKKGKERAGHGKVAQCSIGEDVSPQQHASVAECIHSTALTFDATFEASNEHTIASVSIHLKTKWESPSETENPPWDINRSTTIATTPSKEATKVRAVQYMHDVVLDAQGTYSFGFTHPPNPPHKPFFSFLPFLLPLFPSALSSYI